jgi:hypothetical protein
MHPTAAAASNRRYSQAVPIKLGACAGQQDHKSQQSGAPDPEHETEQQLIGHLRTTLS